MGFGARDAIAVMEARGLNVKLEGSGYVIAQTPSAGADIESGGMVKLTLMDQ